MALITGLNNTTTIQLATYKNTIASFVDILSTDDGQQATYAGIAPMQHIFYMDCASGQIQPYSSAGNLDFNHPQVVDPAWATLLDGIAYLPTDSVTVTPQAASFYKEADAFSDSFRVHRPRRIYDTASYYQLSLKGRFWAPMTDGQATPVVVDDQYTWNGGLFVIRLFRHLFNALKGPRTLGGRSVQGDAVTLVSTSNMHLPSFFWVIQGVSITFPGGSSFSEPTWEIKLESFPTLASYSLDADGWLSGGGSSLTPDQDSENVSADEYFNHPHRAMTTRDFKIYMDYFGPGASLFNVNKILTSLTASVDITWQREAANWGFEPRSSKVDSRYGKHKFLAATNISASLDLGLLMQQNANLNEVYAFNGLSPLGVSLGDFPYSNYIGVFCQPYASASSASALPFYFTDGHYKALWHSKNATLPADDVVEVSMQGDIMSQALNDNRIVRYTNSLV